VSRFFPRKTDYREHKHRRNWRWGIWVGAALLLFALFFYVLAGRTGFWLVQDDSFARVRYAVVLDGQGPDLERTTYAAGLLLDGKVDTLIVMGRRIFRDRNAVDFYVPDMLRQGPVDAGRVLVFRHDDPSTIEEAYSLIPALKQRKVDTVLLITSPAASRRAALLFNELAQGSPVFISCDIGYQQFRPDSWIHTREGRKQWLREWAAMWFARWELLFATPVEDASLKHSPLEPWKVQVDAPNTQKKEPMREEIQLISEPDSIIGH